MNLSGVGLALNNSTSGQIEKDFNVSQENPCLDIKDSKENSFFPEINEQKFNIFDNISSEQCCDIKSYYNTTLKYLLKSEGHLSIFFINKGSRNFIRKNKGNSFFRNGINKNYNGDYINNFKQSNNCIYENKNSFYNKNYNDINQLNNSFLGKNLYLCSNNTIKSQNVVYNKIISNKETNGENNLSNNFCKISNLNINNINLPKNIINQIDSPPIPSNYQKAENNQFPRKKSDDSFSKDKESDSTSAISEKREEEITNESMKKNNKRRNNKKSDNCEYLVEMLGRRGWICKLCNNFNYETRVKCNRCGIMKKPKRILEMNQRCDEEHNKEGDWRCIHCKNLNYYFRTLCNRCNLPKIIPLINNTVYPMLNKMNLPKFQAPSSLLCFNNGKEMI